MVKLKLVAMRITVTFRGFATLLEYFEIYGNLPCRNGAGNERRNDQQVHQRGRCSFSLWSGWEFHQTENEGQRAVVEAMKKRHGLCYRTSRFGKLRLLLWLSKRLKKSRIDFNKAAVEAGESIGFLPGAKEKRISAATI